MRGLAKSTTGITELLDAFDDGSAYKDVDSREFFYTGRRIEV